MSRSSRISLTLTVTGEAAEIMANEIKPIKGLPICTTDQSGGGLDRPVRKFRIVTNLQFPPCNGIPCIG
jgi:hypothetical protein